MPTPEELEQMSKPEILALMRKRARSEIVWGIAGLVIALLVVTWGYGLIPAAVAALGGAYLIGKGGWERYSVNELERPIGRDGKE
jgi:hypothetical protein